MTDKLNFDLLYRDMKKKTVHAKTTSSSSRKVSAKKQSLSFQRIIIITTCVVVAFIGIILTNKSAFERTVAGTAIMKGMFVSGTVTIPTLSEAATFNIYYKEAGEKDFVNAVRGISPNTERYTISHLRKDVPYQYRFAAVDGSGREFLFSEILPLTNIQPM